eukprot:4061428-Lingulodinium_polyedra.AAC.1
MEEQVPAGKQVFTINVDGAWSCASTCQRLLASWSRASAVAAAQSRRRTLPAGRTSLESRASQPSVTTQLWQLVT